jgi:hypothetical protein
MCDVNSSNGHSFLYFKTGGLYNSLNFLFISDFVNILCNDMVYNIYSTITLIWNHEILTNVISLRAGFACVQHNLKKKQKTSLQSMPYTWTDIKISYYELRITFHINQYNISSALNIEWKAFVIGQYVRYEIKCGNC